jgi:hypothetical protein
MQTSATTRRFDPRQIKQAALAIGVVASLAIGATTAVIVRDALEADNTRAGVAANPLASRERAFDYRFMEQNLDLPSAGVTRAANDDFNYQFMEQNLYLPGDIGQPATRSYEAIRFREQNLDLPGSNAAAAPNWKVLEENSWGEDFVFETDERDSLPSSEDVPQLLAGEVAY